MKCLPIAMVVGPLIFLAGCRSAEDRDIDASLSKVSTFRSNHPHYPVMAFDDFGNDNGPVGIPVDVYSFYCHAATKPNPLETVSTVNATSQRLASIFAKAIQSLIKLEATTPPPDSPYPTTPDWKQAPHPAPGTYVIVVKNGTKTSSFQVQCPIKPGELAAPKFERLTPELLKDAKRAVTEHAQLELAEMRALKPPPGFTLATQEMLNLRQGSKSVEPHLIGDPLCLVPVDKRLAMAGLDHSIKRLLTATAHLDSKPQVAHLLVRGPGFEATYPIVLAAGKDQDQAVATAEKAVGSVLDDLNRKAS